MILYYQQIELKKIDNRRKYKIFSIYQTKKSANFSISLLLT
jgi:hypothetical protein